jgi:CHAD domain-containing protein
MSQVTEVAFGSVARRLRKDLKVLGADPSDEALHELRIVSKRLRYVLEGLGSLIERERFLGDALKEAQKALGEFQDRSVLLGRLREQIMSVRSPKSPIDALSFGLLLGTLADEHALQKRHAAKAAFKLGKKAFLHALEYRHAT